MVLTCMLPLPKNLLPECPSALLLGEDGTCKTSFVFRYCHSIAEKYPDREVVYISTLRIFKYPLSVDGMGKLSVETAKRVHIYYPMSLENLIQDLAKFFTLNVFPCAFIVDDLDYIIKQRKNPTLQNYYQLLSRVFALIVDNVEYVKSVSGQSCQLLVASGFDKNIEDDFLLIKRIGEQFFNEIFTIQRTELLESTSTAFKILPKDESYKIIISVKDDSIKLHDVSIKSTTDQSN